VVLVHDRSTLRQREVQSTDRPKSSFRHARSSTNAHRSTWRTEDLTPTLPARRSRRHTAVRRRTCVHCTAPLMFGNVGEDEMLFRMFHRRRS
jgi:hypothetical protein